jgi:tetratricopeptide (TPR) repeat protein
MSPAKRTDFFISYTQVDRQWAEWIGWQLEAIGYTTRIQAWDFRPGANFVLEMQRAATESERTIAVLSEAYMASSFTQPEWAAAFAADPTSAQHKLVPVRVTTCDINGLLASVVYIDLADCSQDEEARERLLAGISPARAKPDLQPPFPRPASSTQAPQLPERGPTICNAPSPSRNFTGREVLIDLLTDGFARSQDLPVVQVLHGLGGVGKSETAARFAEIHRNDYDVIWWIRAGNDVTRQSELARLANELELLDPATHHDEDDALTAAAAWLREHGRWLLVLDDAAGPDAVDPSVLPSGAGRGHVLITSRQAGGWRNVATPLHVNTWAREDSIAFLSRRTGLHDDVGAGRLAEEFGDLPLALEQAGAYIDALGLDFDEYLGRVERHAPALLAMHAPRGYDASVATTWSLAFDALAAEDDARHLLDVCACMASDPIPTPILSAVLPDALRRDRALGAAFRFSLLTSLDGAVSMHRLVQQSALQSMADGERDEAAADAVRALTEAFPDEPADLATWPLITLLIPHVVAVSLDNTTPGTDADFWVIIQRLARFHGARSEFDRALPLLVGLLDAIEKNLGPHSEALIRPASETSYMLAELGDIDGAFTYMEQALTLAEEHWEYDEHFAILLDGASNVLDSAGQFEQAISWREQAIALYEELDPEPVVLATALANMGGSYLHMQALDEARDHYQRCLVLLDECDDVPPPLYANALGGLADVHDFGGDYCAALPYHEQALGLLERTLGETNFAVAQARVNFCWTLIGLADWDRAASEMQSAGAVLSQMPARAATVVRLSVLAAIIAYGRGDLDRALQLFDEALASTHAEDHRQRRFQLLWMIWINAELERPVEADARRQDLFALGRPAWGASVRNRRYPHA